MEIRLNIGSYVKGIKTKLKVSNEELSHILGVSPRSIVNYLNGLVPSKKEAKKIIDFILYKNFDIFELLNLDSKDFLFHGSKTKIIGTITTSKNVGKKIDFGQGFYLSESFKTAVTYVDKNIDPHIYRFKKSDVLKGPIYNFSESIDDIKNWVLFIGFNRGKILDEKTSALFSSNFNKYFKGYSVLIGKIADSFNFDVLEAFFDYEYDIFQVEKALKQVDIGNQVVVKDEKLANSIIDYDEIFLHKDLKQFIYDWHKKETEKNRVYNKEGIDKKSAKNGFKFEQIIEEYIGKLNENTDN